MNFSKRQIHFLHNNNLLKQEKEYLDIQNRKKCFKENGISYVVRKSLMPFVLIDLLVSDDKGQFHAIILLLWYVSLGIVYFPSINLWLMTHKL